MLIEDKFKDKGLFASMREQSLQLPIVINNDILDILYSNLHGIRHTSRLCDTLSVDDCALFVYNMFSRKWNSVYEMMLSNYGLPSGNVTTVSENITTDTTNDTTNDTSNKVSAFNDFVDDGETETENDEFANNDISNSVSNSVTNNERVREYTKTVEKIADKTELLDMLQLNFICDIMFTDINTILTLSIFN